MNYEQVQVLKNSWAGAEAATTPRGNVASVIKYTCRDDAGCQLNGACIAGGACKCRPGWKGLDCGLLDILPSTSTSTTPRHSFSTSANGTRDPTAAPPTINRFPGLAYGSPPSATGNTGLASWGGSIVVDPKNASKFHLFAAEMSLGCGLNSWSVRAVSVRSSAVVLWCCGAVVTLLGLVSDLLRLSFSYILSNSPPLLPPHNPHAHAIVEVPQLCHHTRDELFRPRTIPAGRASACCVQSRALCITVTER